MKHIEAMKIEDEDYKKRMSLREKKAHDYAKTGFDEDILSNFKVVAAVCKALKNHGYEVDITTPKGVAMFHIIHKNTRLLNLFFKDESPENESVKDTVLDLSNYIDLMKECMIDEYKEKMIELDRIING